MKQEKSVWDKSIKVEESGYYWNGEPIFSKGADIPTDKPTVLELFCGCGGTSLGFEQNGFEVILGCDIHKPSIDTFSRNHPNASTILGDVRRVNPLEVKNFLGGRKVDVMIAGVPCQGFSLNNRKRHAKDDRNMMYKEFVKFIKELQPRAIVLENVSGMRSTGNFVADIEKDLSLAGGMKVTSKLLYAPNYGVPQKRRRLVFVGIKGVNFDFSEVQATHGDGLTPYVTIKEAIGDLPSLKPKETVSEYTKPATCAYQKMMRSKSGAFECHTSPNHPKETIERIRSTSPGEPMYANFKQRIRLSWDSQSPTQVSGGIRPQFQFGHPADARGLTIRERCRIQSFPDDFVVEGGTVQGRVQTGNAVPPLLAGAVARAIRNHL